MLEILLEIFPSRFAAKVVASVGCQHGLVFALMSNSLVSCDLILDHLSLEISLTTIAQGHLKEPVQYDCLIALNEAKSHCRKDVFHTCTRIMELSLSNLTQCVAQPESLATIAGPLLFALTL